MANTDITVVTDPSVFQSLQAEWDELWDEADGTHIQAFAVGWLCWTKVAQPQGKRLHCIVYRENGKLALVWPLVSHRRLFWNVLDPLTPGTAEHPGMLVAEGPHTSRAVASAWEAACKRCGGDIFMLPYVATGSLLHDHASQHAQLLAASNDVSLKAIFPQSMDWDTFCASLGTLEKRKPGVRLRRLAKQGDLVIRLLGPEDSASFDKWVAWTLARKLEWVARTGKVSSWLGTSTYHNYLVALLQSADERSKAHLFTATLDGAPIASMLMGMGKKFEVSIITAFDDKFAKSDPGLIIIEHCVKCAFDLGHGIDFGIGPQRFKSYWSRDNVLSHVSFEIATSPLGQFAFHIKRLARSAKRGSGRHTPSVAHAIPLDAEPENLPPSV